MDKMEMLIRDRSREDFYGYYKSLGYEDKVAAALALFVYGRYRYSTFSLDDLCDALCEGRPYLPPEYLEEQKRIEERRIALEKAVAERRAAMEKAVAERRGVAASAAPTEQIYRREAPAPKKGKNLGIPFFRKKEAEPMRTEAEPRTGSMPDFSMFEEAGLPDSAPAAATPSFLRAASPVGGAGAASARPNYEQFLRKSISFVTDEYEPIEEKAARETAKEPTSTFRMTTNTASAGVILNQLRNERSIDKSMVRIEELLNYFRYESEKPAEEMFRISTEMMDAPNGRNKYLYINVQGKELVKERQNIVILLDVSGSMNGNAEQTQAIVATILSKLNYGDRLSLVTYSNRDSIELNGLEIRDEKDRRRALETLLSLRISGGTYGSAGIEQAYQIGKEHYMEDGNNQVILITDGDLNFGITDKGGLADLIEEKKKDNLFLSVIGTGLWNYKDDKLEVLSKHGNGVYRTVNNLADVRKCIDEEYASLVNIIAKDVKAQVEFNPEVVKDYRLLGFENRALSREDFTDDTVISEPFGSGGYGVALYELSMKDSGEAVDSGLKYSKIVTSGSVEPGTVKIRYKEPLEDTSHELEKVIENAQEHFTDNLRLAFIVYVCAEKLRGSNKISGEELTLAMKLYGELGETVRENNRADLFKLAGILEKSEKELGIGIHAKEPFPW